MVILSIWMIIIFGFIIFILGGLIASIFWIQSFKTLVFRLTEEEFNIIKNAMYRHNNPEES